MWEAHQHGRTVVAISPLGHNWAIKFLSHLRYNDLTEFETAVQSGQFAARLAARIAAAPSDETPT
jgi:hypothetical protein